MDEKCWDKYEKNDEEAEQKCQYHQKVLIDNKRNANGYANSFNVDYLTIQSH
jgi:hypothetical protein